MTFTLENAIVYDIETLPNVFTLHWEALHGDTNYTFEISDRRDDRIELNAWFWQCRTAQTPMIGFNSVHFDYPVIHALFNDPHMSVADIYAKAMTIIRSNDRFAHTIWESDRFAPQIDLFKINHFDNRAKTTSLKALQINMRSPTVVDSPVEFGTNLTHDQITRDLIPYNRHDVQQTKAFAHMCMSALQMRIGLIEQFGLDVLNFNDTKIGSKTLEQRLGDDVCFTRNEDRRKVPRQTPRRSIALADIIFPYVRFAHPEFQRVLDYMRAQVLTPDDLEDPEAQIKTKGVFSGLVANVGGLDFYFGTGGIHGSVTNRRFVATPQRLIRDIDVAALYPSIGIVNNLAPEHLGQAFVAEYSRLPAERKLHAKGTVQNASLKLAANGTYGNTNNRYSPFYDPQYTMTITINGQLLLCMLAEWLVRVPTIELIQINTDGITYAIDAAHEPEAAEVCRNWQTYTGLVLEDANYARMWISDVNTYVAETTDGKLKQKGRLWHPDANDYARSISEASPPAWHKDLGNVASIRAAVTAMTQGIDPEMYLHILADDPYDFMCRARATSGSHLLLGGRRIQATTRYYVALDGEPLVKISPPVGTEGAFKRANGVTEAEYDRVMSETGGAWDERVCTKNKSRYVTREMAIEAGWKVAECNDVRSFDWSNVNYAWYVAEARKLIVTP